MNSDCGRCRRADDSDEGEGEQWSVENDIDDGLFLTCGRKCATYDDREDEGDDVLAAADDDIWTGCADDSAVIAGTSPPYSVYRLDMRPPVHVQTVSRDFQGAYASYATTRQATAQDIDLNTAMTVPADKGMDFHASRAMPTRVLIGSKEPLPTAAFVPRTPAPENFESNTEMTKGTGHDIEMHTVMTMPTVVLSREPQEHQIGSTEPLPTATFGNCPLQTATFGNCPLPTATFGTTAAQPCQENMESFTRSLVLAQDPLPSTEALPTFSSLPTSRLA